MNPFFYRRILAWLVTIMVPAVLVLTCVRILLFPVFLTVEYNLPAFPDDPYGFSKAERLHWSRIAVDYLLNSNDITFLGDLRFTDGKPVYNERELSHMVDVKKVVQSALMAWYIILILTIAIGVWAWQANWWEDYRLGLIRGGWLTILLMITACFFVLVGFGDFFVAFHNVFFKPGTWLFYYSDTLIRLFPERFWRDAFIFVGGLAISGSLLLSLGLRRK